MKKILLSVISLLIAAILAFGCVVFVYYPHYVKNKYVSQIPSDDLNSEEIRVMSCNVRCINPLDFFKKSWFYRADLVIKNIENNYPGIIGFQEVTKWQYKYLSDSLPQYEHQITYRDESVNSEGCPVFFRTDLYSLVDIGSFWLSETPDVMSKSWNAAYNRICGYVILEQKSTGERFVVFNTHLDHKSEEARINGMNVILAKIEEFGSLPAIIMGDLNSTESSDTYKNATSLFLDAKYETEKTMTGCTYQAFGKNLDDENIDYFMISKQGVKVLEYKVLNNTFNGVYSSDHFPIFTVIVLEK